METEMKAKAESQAEAQVNRLKWLNRGGLRINRVDTEPYPRDNETHRLWIVLIVVVTHRHSYSNYIRVCLNSDSRPISRQFAENAICQVNKLWSTYVRIELCRCATWPETLSMALECIRIARIDSIGDINWAQSSGQIANDQQHEDSERTTFNAGQVFERSD